MKYGWIKHLLRKNSAGADFGPRRRINVIEGANVTLTVADDPDNDEIDLTIAAASDAPTNADYLVGTANASLSNEIVVGTTPGGELGGTWAVPTVDATHSGSAHHDILTLGDTMHSLATQVLSGAAASATVVGHVELATAAETSTGTDATRAVTPDGLAGSVHGEVAVEMVVFDWTTDCATGDGKFYFHVDDKLSGANLVRVHAECITAGTTGTMDIQIANVDAAVDMLSTKITIDSGETGSDTALTPAVINAANDDVQTNEVLRIDIDAIHSGTAAKGLIVTMVFRLP